MAFIWAHDLGGYTTMATLVSRLGLVTSGTACTISATSGRFGRQSVQVNGNGEGFGKAFAGASGKIICHSCFKFTSFDGAVARPFLYFSNNAGAAKCLELQTLGGSLIVKDAADATVSTTPAVFSTGVEHVVVVEAEIGSGSGTVRIWVDNMATPLVDLSAIDLDDGAAGACDQIYWYCTSNNTVFDVSQILIYDTSGAGDWSAFMGDKALYPLVPDSDDTSEWTPTGASTHYTEVDDPIASDPDDDTTYVNGDTADTDELFGFPALPTGVTGIVGVIALACLKKTDAGALPSTLHLRAKASGGTTADSASLASLTTSYTEEQHLFPDEPGGSGWTKTQVDGAFFGLRLEV